MKARELAELTTAEIQQKLSQYKEELFNLRFQSATGQLESPARLRQVRKAIARCKTILRERELGIERRKQG
ncbi:50S ribosomal protein L29 [Staphylospora marina]|jgi:large subunit ribosomal protein L29|uniref:50S ribosomal protein L29 n=1 Tax=Staphylospora marina TaxID=2490858 RepID=UPI000F5BDFB6|nr:50S ribosomal protein L29 [Staphylospora marina]